MSKLIILVVDDSASFLKSIEEILLVESFHVLVASDLQSAWEIYQTKNPDLVITDVNLSAVDIENKSGFELLKRIDQQTKNLNKTTPVILMSSDQSIEDEINDFPSGSVSFIAKPFDPKILLEKISCYCK